MFFERDHFNARAGVELRVLPLEFHRHFVPLRLRLFDGHARFEPPDHAEKVAAGPELLRVQIERCPELGLNRELLPGGRHADNLIGQPVEQQRFAEGVWIGAESVPPKGVTDHYDRGGAGTLLMRLEAASKRGLRAKRREKVGRDRSPYNLLRRAFAAETQIVRDEG